MASPGARELVAAEGLPARSAAEAALEAKGRLPTATGWVATGQVVPPTPGRQVASGAAGVEDARLAIVR
jgi:hypothetical protein